MKRMIVILIAVILCISCSVSGAERKTVEKDQFYLGAMRVVNCKEYVSLRERPDKTSRVLAKVPAGAIVLYCSNNFSEYAAGSYKKQVKLFIRCEYEGTEGYILKKHLASAPDMEPVETRQNSSLMTREEVKGNGEIILDWKEYNVSVQAAYEVINENGENWEYVRVGCFIDDEPNWGYTEAVRQAGETRGMKVFMGGTEDEPQVYIYDAQYGLTMLDLMDGMEVWSLMKQRCFLGDAAICAVDGNNGNLYVASTDNPDPVALSCDGEILWKADIKGRGVTFPKDILLNPYDIEVMYENGKTVSLDYYGKILQIADSL